MTIVLPDELVAVLNKMRTASEVIIQEFKTPWGNEPAPDIIYHYSTSDGTGGILASGSLWLSDIFQMNDPSEIEYGVQSAVTLATELGRNGIPELAFFADHFSKLSEGGIRRSAHYFVASFSKNGDELGQWRAYADDGMGYALGFDGNILEQAFAPPAPRGEGKTTFPLQYSSSILRKVQEQLVKLAVRSLTAPSNAAYARTIYQEFLRRIVLEFALAAFTTAIYFKHPAYRAEEEYRFLNIQPGDREPVGAQTRETILGPCRHIIYDWRKVAPNALREIIIGPAASEQARDRLINWLSGNGYDLKTIEIRKSPMPYRSLRR